MKKLLFAPIVSLLIWLVLANIALAQDPDDYECYVPDDYDVSSTYSTYVAANMFDDNLFTFWNAASGTEAEVYLDDADEICGLSGAIPGGVRVNSVIDTITEETLWTDIGGWTTGDGDLDTVDIVFECTSNEIQLNVWRDIPEPYLQELRVCIYTGTEEPPISTCTTVPNYHFTTDDTWTRYSPNAVITNSTLTLTDGDVALQNITGLQQSSYYNAVLSVTQIVSGPISLNVSLGDVANVVSIDAAGYVTTTLQTPDYTGAYQYALWNQSDEGTIVLDATCLYFATQDSGYEQYECIAPTNGEFSSADSWEYLRGASWETPAQRAGLPDADMGLIRSTESYSLPELGTGEYLLMGFDSASTEDAGGGVSARVADSTLSNEVVYNFSNYILPYRFEMDISNLAGMTDTNVALVNPGTALTGTNPSDIWVDNVCIFVADRTLQLPTPLDPDAIDPVDLGFNYGSCDDVDSIFAFFNVNIQQYRAEYEAGTSVWDPVGWVPWLIAAFWVILATYACFFMGAFVTLVNILEYIINNGLNIWSWVGRMWPATLDWSDQWQLWSGLSIENLSDAYGTFLAAWAEWIGDALTLVSGTIGVTLSAASTWIGQSLVNMSDWLGESLVNLWGWLSTYLLNFNGLRTIVNWLIAGWNAFLIGLGLDISAVLDDLAWIWNNGLGPALQSIFSALWSISPLQLPYTIMSLFFSLLGLMWAAIQWVWVNVVSVGHTPLTFYQAFDTGINSAAYDPLTGCAVDPTFWCIFLAGVQIINQTTSHSIFYPIIIVGMILSTIVILWQNLTELFDISIDLTGIK